MKELQGQQVGEVSKKMQESRLKWYGDVMRREEEYVGLAVMVMRRKTEAMISLTEKGRNTRLLLGGK